MIQAMQIVTPLAFRPRPANPAWCARIFDSDAARKSGIVRRAVRDVDREVGRAALEYEVRQRGFHLIECGGQFIIICNDGHLRTIC